jgi:hypothetical protein
VWMVDAAMVATHRGVVSLMIESKAISLELKYSLR